MDRNMVDNVPLLLLEVEIRKYLRTSSIYRLKRWHVDVVFTSFSIIYKWTEKSVHAGLKALLISIPLTFPHISTFSPPVVLSLHALKTSLNWESFQEVSPWNKASKADWGSDATSNLFISKSAATWTIIKVMTSQWDTFQLCFRAYLRSAEMCLGICAKGC